MTLSTCDQVAERIALGEALGELTEHVATCERCQPVVALPGKLGVTRHAVDPGLGFSARMTVGAQHLLAVRRRRRFAAGLAATVACGTLGVFVVTRNPAPTPTSVATATQTTQPKDDAAPEDTAPAVVADEDLAALVELADVDRSVRVSAKWTHIKKPLAAYKKLLKGETP